jgi:PIN domain nuclease of toxin-antitoxin system
MAIDRADTVWVSAISAWEISLLVSKQKLILPDTSKSWFEKVLDQHRLSLAGLSVDVLVSANELPWHHRDPADRFIIATAQATGASVVTTDRKFELYDVPVVR